MQKAKKIYGADHEKENVTDRKIRLIAYGEKASVIKKAGTKIVEKRGEN